MKTKTFLAFALLITLHQLFALPALAEDALSKQINVSIPPNTPMEQALIDWGIEAGVTVMIDTETVRPKVTHGAHGWMNARDALTIILVGSGLAYAEDGPRIQIVPAGSLVKSAMHIDASKMQTITSSTDEAPPPSGSGTAAGVTPSSNQGRLDEVVVTAQKRTEKLLDVPAAISTISGTDLESLHAQSLSDIAGYVPGLSITGFGSPGSRVIVIRGLSSDYQGGAAGPLVGTYIDDIPVGASTSTARGSVFGLDLMPYDIERVEVLEGPQGTLYGSNTMAGLIKYTLKEPDLTNFEARAGTYVQDVDGSESPDWGVRSAVNLPLISGNLGLRLSGFDQSSAGWIDNIGTDTRDANHSIQKGGRAALLWQITDGLSVESTMLYQDIRANDTTSISVNPMTRQPIYGYDIKDTYFPEPFAQQTRLYDITVNADLGLATLTSSSAWSKVESGLHEDFTIPYGQYTPIPNALTLYEISDHLAKFVEEVRVTSKENTRIKWMLGGFFTREYGAEDSSWPYYTSNYIPTGNLLYASGGSEVYREYAAFGNSTYKVTDNWDVSAGYRYSVYHQFSCGGEQSGIFAGSSGPCSTLPSTGVSTWMVNSDFHFNQNLMLYGRIATGYRPGQRCESCPSPLAPDAPSIVKSDKTTNYEMGLKGESSDHRLQFTASVFDIEWTDIQVLALSQQGFAYADNAGTARSDGVELSSSYQLVSGLRLSTSVSFIDARLTENTVSGVGGNDGDQLPISPHWTSFLGLDYTWALDKDTSMLAGGSYRYRDMIVNEFSGAAQVGSLPSPPQNIFDLYTGLEWRQFDFRLYGRNVFNNHSYAGLMYVNDPSVAKFVPIQPRTVGISIDYKF